MNDELKNKTFFPPLPKGWVWVRLGEIGEYINGRAFKPSEWEKHGRPIIRIQNLTGSTDKINYYSKPIEEKFIVRNGDLLISWSATLGVFIYKGEEAVLNQHIFKVQPYIDRKFLYFLFTAFIEELKRKVHGTGMQHITKYKFENSYVPLPPLPEQHRIVAKIEELFTKLDAGVEALKKAKEQIKRYRQAVLKYAFEGKLTEEWRKNNVELLMLNDELKQIENSTLNIQHSKLNIQNYEPASILLEKIKAERKKKLGKKYKELPPVDTSELPELPEGWVWVRLGEITEMIQYGTSEKATSEFAGIPVLRMGNIQDGKIIFKDLKYFPKEWPYINDFILQDGDILFNRTNSAELVGKTAVYKKFHPPAVFASYLIRIKVNKNFYVSDLLSYFINSIFGKEYIASVVSQQVGQANVNGTKLSLMPIPLPPLSEQHKIVEEIERRFSVADEVEKAIDNSLKQAERLRQSILKRAFEGKLVPQDPNDEPAEKLLERIKAEKEKQFEITRNNFANKSKGSRKK
ncbi:MAG: restriction endonuclease subunit S [Melioribacter sp.]|uniref:restriction endonuclease subunit S n=1 Tax=Rosettibacter primus TaxID=3111523 RepID=UPI00247BCB0E|nr:restriction endonuclease subunit S [Melioribacter sp.]